jgi:hypothetical protein
MSARFLIRKGLPWAAALAACWTVPVLAASLKVDYAISLAGLHVGTADVAASVDGERYKVDIQARVAGLAGAFSDARGGAAASGSVASNRPLPSSYAVTSRSSQDQRTVRVGLAGGNAVSVQVEPPIEDRPDRVPVRDVHKRGVIDPVSALLMPLYGRGDLLDPAVCNRTLPVFDGGARFNIVLSYAERREVEKPGYRGPVIVCNARYVAIAGHRPDRPGTRFMEENRDISVWLAPIEGTRVLFPMRISVRTMAGVSVIEATRWAADGGGRPIRASVRHRRS